MNLIYLLATVVKLDSGSVSIPKNDANTILASGLNSVYVVAGVIAVIAIVLAGFKYVTAAGDSAAIAKAKNTILYAVVGLVVIILAFAVTWFVIGRF